MLRGLNLNKRWGGTVGLSDVNMEIKGGEIACIVGPSGSGKSTLLRCLCLVEPPDSGLVEIDGKEFAFPSTEYSKKDIPWPKITMVFQQLFLWPHLSLRENVRLPLQELNCWDESEFRLLVKRLQIDRFLDRFPNEVSLGQRQRVALARGLLLNPRYLLLDEITSALDVEQVSTISSILEEHRKKGMGIAITTHLLGFARRLADKIVFLDGGEVLAYGANDLLVDPDCERLRAFLQVSG